MYKFFLYCVLIVMYLGLSKALSPSEHGVQYLQNERGFSKLIKGNYSTVILIDAHTTGFLIKTYYQKFRVISGYDSVEELIVRTNKEFSRRNLAHIGLSLYRKTDTHEEFVPLPPGSIYLNNREFGSWKTNKKGETYWKFNKSFKNLPKYLGWSNFRPDMEFYQRLRSHASSGKPFYGSNGEFGPQGRITRENFPNYFREDRKKMDLKSLLIEYFRENF
jgi:hypothetical protein